MLTPNQQQLVRALSREADRTGKVQAGRVKEICEAVFPDHPPVRVLRHLTAHVRLQPDGSVMILVVPPAVTVATPAPALARPAAARPRAPAQRPRKPSPPPDTRPVPGSEVIAQILADHKRLQAFVRFGTTVPADVLRAYFARFRPEWNYPDTRARIREKRLIVTRTGWGKSLSEVSSLGDALIAAQAATAMITDAEAEELAELDPRLVHERKRLMQNA